VAIDIGANNGTYSYVMGKHAGTVVSFEPNRDLWPRLRRLLGRSARLEAAALSDANGRVTMRIDPENTGVSTIEAENAMSCSEHPEAVVSREVEVRTLDSYGFRGVSLIKIDVEGHEESVVAGAVETLKRERPALIIESEDRHKAGAPRRLAERLGGLGYGAYYLRGGELREFATLTAEMTDAAVLERGGEYINNFIFVHKDDAGALEKMRRNPS
jgi:FkbM family methyltransferase